MTTLADYASIVGEERIEELWLLSRYVGGRTLRMVNSTSVGGGVAEMLQRIVPFLNELGIAARWDVIKGGEDFFAVTKSFHNALQGNMERLADKSFATYAETVAANASQMDLDDDLVVIHDPQPAALIDHFPRRRGKWVWRCHVDLSNPNPQVWEFLRPLVNRYDAAIFSHPVFSRRLDIPQFRFFPAIDPLSDKNRDVDDETVRRTFEKFGVPLDKPVVTQVSRFDPWKDPLGVIQAFKKARRSVDCRLLLVGDKAADDPEADVMVEKMHEAASNDPDIHIVYLRPSIPIEINAIQRGSTLVLQKSLREGFALTVAEALWKKRPVIAGAVGGIPSQIKHALTGVLVHSVDGASYWIRVLLSNPPMAAQLGESGHDHIREHFLITKLVRRYLLLMIVLDNPGRSHILLA
jgi:trehalose synthase